MKAAKWREMSDEEVQQKARELGEELFNLRFQLSMGVAKNPARVAIARRDLARAHDDSEGAGAAHPADGVEAGEDRTVGVRRRGRAWWSATR